MDMTKTGTDGGCGTRLTETKDGRGWSGGEGTGNVCNIALFVSAHSPREWPEADSPQPSGHARLAANGLLLLISVHASIHACVSVCLSACICMYVCMYVSVSVCVLQRHRAHSNLSFSRSQNPTHSL